tara:strand:+ start:2074 stop:2493 length:420 start_codon:yes stop_codon:yes gene_type:complete
MAITITDNALEELTTDNFSGDVSTRYLILNKRVHTFPESITLTGDNIGNVIPLKTMNVAAHSDDFLHTYVTDRGYFHFDESTRVGTGYSMTLTSSESDNKQQVPNTNIWITWSDDNHSTFDGKTIDFDYINNLYTITHA